MVDVDIDVGIVVVVVVIDFVFVVFVVALVVVTMGGKETAKGVWMGAGASDLIFNYLLI